MISLKTLARPIYYLFLIWSFILLPLKTPSLFAQQSGTHNEIGLPYLRIFSPSEYNGGTQTWSLVQDKRGVLYAANNAGVLEYDGVSWRLIEVPNKAAVRTITVDEKGRIYVGLLGNIGYLAPDSAGQAQFISLTEHIPELFREFGAIAKTYAVKEGVYFQALDRLFRWDGTIMKVWKPASRFHLSFLVKDRFFIRKPGIGLFEMINDSLQMVPNSTMFASERIYAMFPFREDNILIATRNSGLMLYDGRRFKPFPTNIDQFLIDNQISHGANLQNGNFVIATLRGGAVILDESGKLLHHLNQATGLIEQNVKYLYSDRENGLWLGLNNGISRMETPLLFSKFNAETGLKGAVYSIARHQGDLFAASDQGVFKLDERAGVNPGNLPNTLSQFRAIPGINRPAWSLLSTGNSLLAATSDGLYTIENEQATRITSAEETAFILFRSKLDSNRVYAGLKSGFASLTTSSRNPGEWQYEGKLEGLISEVRSITETPEGHLWLGTRAHGFIRITFPGTFSPTPQIKSYDEKKGLPKNHGWVITFRTSDRTFFTTDSGLFRFDTKLDSFILDASLGEEYLSDENILTSVYVDRQDKIWAQTDISGARENLKLGYATLQKDQTYHWERTIFNRINDTRIRTFYPDADGIMWLGGPDGLIRYDSRIKKDYTTRFNTMVRRVNTSTTPLIYAGMKPFDDGILPDPPDLPYSENELRFDFSAPSFDDNSRAVYRYRLEGQNENWSAWTSETYKDYNNLSPGSYQFRVQGRDIYGQLGLEDTFRFSIQPPWYLTWWAFLLYFSALALVVFGFIRLRTYQLQQRNKMLRETVNQRTLEIRQKAEELQNANEELDQKNRELVRTRDQLVVQEKLASLGSLTAGIAHELKNPLNFVTNFAKLSQRLAGQLSDKMETKKDSFEEKEYQFVSLVLEDLKTNTAAINRHGQRADSIIQSMMFHSREGGSTRQPVDINAMLEENLNLAYHGMRAKDPAFNVKIEKDFDSSIDKIDVIPQDVSRVFLNIINNGCYAAFARKASDGDDFMPTIEVKSKNAGNKVEIRIRDNGSGIPPDVRDQIFQPFFTTKPTGEGTGLGLSISYDIIVAGHNGELKVESEEDKFTEFTILLPKG